MQPNIRGFSEEPAPVSLRPRQSDNLALAVILTVSISLGVNLPMNDSLTASEIEKPSLKSIRMWIRDLVDTSLVIPLRFSFRVRRSFARLTISVATLLFMKPL